MLLAHATRESAELLQDVLTVVVCDEVGDRDPIMRVCHTAAIVGF